MIVVPPPLCPPLPRWTDRRRTTITQHDHAQSLCEKVGRVTGTRTQRPAILRSSPALSGVLGQPESRSLARVFPCNPDGNPILSRKIVSRISDRAPSAGFLSRAPRAGSPLALVRDAMRPQHETDQRHQRHEQILLHCGILQSGFFPGLRTSVDSLGGGPGTCPTCAYGHEGLRCSLAHVLEPLPWPAGRVLRPDGTTRTGGGRLHSLARRLLS